MTDNNSQGIDIGFEYIKELYTNTDIETKEAQPIFVVHRDTVRSFFHEKIELLGVKYRLLAYAGIEASLLAALGTASFQGWRWIGGDLIQGLFVAFAIIIGLLVLKDGYAWWCETRGISVNDLADELGERGSVIRPATKPNSADTNNAFNSEAGKAGAG